MKQQKVNTERLLKWANHLKDCRIKVDTKGIDPTIETCQTEHGTVE